MAFATALLTPAILLALVGNRALAFMQKTGRTISNLDKFNSLILFSSGIYIITRIDGISTNDLIFTSVLFILFVITALWKSDRKLKESVIDFILIGVLYLASITPCYNIVSKISYSVSPDTCTATGGCTYCVTCTTLFVALIFISSIVIIRPYGRFRIRVGWERKS